VSGSPVVPSADLERKSRPRGYFVTGRLWTGKFLKELEEITNTGIKINSVTDTAINQNVENPDEQNSIVILTFLKDFRNQNTARLDFTSKTQYKQNQKFFLYFTLIPLFISVILGFVFYFIFRSWIMVPLKLLNKSLDRENLEPLEKISPRNKEFHAISSMMMAFFEAKKKIELGIKDRKLAEERILKLSTALEQSFSTIVITDPDGNIEYASKRFFDLTGYNRSEITGKNPRILQSGHHDTGFYQNLWETIKGGKTWKGEFLNKKKNGSLFWEAATITPIKDFDGHIINYLAVKEDITEQKDAREKLVRITEDLKESNISKDKFFSILAHDLKAPFHSILGYSELLATEYDTMTDSDRRKFIQILRTSTKNVYDLVENLLQWSRLQTGRLTSVPEVFDLASEIEYSSDIFRAVAFKKNIRFDAGVTAGNLVMADRNMVRSVLQNLISNALKFTPGGGSVAISAELRNKEMQVSIQDSGVGMDAGELDKLFRIDISFSKRGTAMESGTGLGLILCKELIVMNNGRIWVESQPGKGSTFRFTLPSATA
jgi:PAS domain S-box-containing protein